MPGFSMDEPVRRVAVVGGGVAGCRSVFELRRMGFDGAVTLVSAETHPPYDRTRLSKDLLRLGEPAGEPTPLRALTDYADDQIDLRLGERARAIDADARTLRLDTGEELPFDRLIICTGGHAVLPRAIAAPGVLTLREVEDAVRLRERLERCRRIVIIGGGFIGGEIASCARELAIDVTLVEAASAPLAPILGIEVGDRIADLHRAAGVRLRCGVAARGVNFTGSEYNVALDDGTALTADLVIAGVGMRPHVSWVERWLDTDDGLVTNAHCHTELPGVLAAGDCARWWHPGYNVLTRVEHWDTAGRHGAAAARAALGSDEPFAPLPFFWSDQHGVKLQWAGYAPRWDEVEISDGPAGTFVARYRCAERVMGVFAAGQPRAIRRERIGLKEDLDSAVEGAILTRNGGTS